MKSETKDSAVEPPPLSMHGRLRVHVTDTIIHPGEDHANDATRNFSNHTMVRTGGSRNLFDNTSSNSSSVNNGEGDTYDARKIPWRSLSSPVGGNGDDDSSSRNHNNEMNRDGITQHSVSVQQQFLSHNTSSSHATSNQKQYRLVRPPKVCCQERMKRIYDVYSAD